MGMTAEKSRRRTGGSGSGNGVKKLSGLLLGHPGQHEGTRPPHSLALTGGQLLPSDWRKRLRGIGFGLERTLPARQNIRSGGTHD